MTARGRDVRITSLVLAALTTGACAAAPRAGAPELEEAAPPIVLDGFEDAAAWEAAPATGVEMRLSADAGVSGRALRVDFDFRGGGGWAAFRRELPVHLPDNYELTFWLRGDAPVNTLELKLIDASGENVWWINRPGFEFAGGWRAVTFRRRHVTFAWGPAEGGEIRDVAAIELAITAGTGGRGTVWLDSLTLTPRAPVQPYDILPVASATSAAAGAPPAHAVDGDPATMWRAAGPGEQTLTIDFQRTREYGGLIVRWDSTARAADYDVEVSDDGVAWRTVRRVRGGAGPADYLRLPETESRLLRVNLPDQAPESRNDPGRQVAVPAAHAIRELEVRTLEWGDSHNALFETIAAESPPGHYPKYFGRVQSYWTLVGADGGAHEALINEEGAVEVGKGAFSIEPFLFSGGRLHTWADAAVTQSLPEGYLPIPSVLWRLQGLELEVTAWTDAVPSDMLSLRYRVRNTGTAVAHPTLHLGLRPFQVNPSWQFLNTPGGVARIHRIGRPGPGQPITVQDRLLFPLTPPSAFGATTFDAGGVLRHLARDGTPSAARVEDPPGLASGALSYRLDIPPGEARDVVLEVTMAPAAEPEGGFDTRFPFTAEQAAAYADDRLERAVRGWRERLDRFAIDLPASAPPLGDLVRSNLAWVLINRDGPAIQPGSRSYERSWIRDGSLTSAALLRLGQEHVVREFIEWYAPYQYDNGKVPCCVDHRGADPVPEHDSHGQLIYLIAEYFRYTADTATARRWWPNVASAVAHIDSLRQLRMTDVYRQPDSAAYYGMVPQSISHEGYAAKPMHSYWDAFFVLKGLKDAVFLAELLGEDDARQRMTRIRDEFRRDLHESLRRAMALHGIDYLPGSVELGDFDATSTTVGITPAGELSALEAPLRSTFERYWRNFERRRSGTEDWDAYTPYELRAIGTFVRLGDRRRAHDALAWFMRDIRPRPWNHWAEVVSRDAEEPRFIGDMPHGWVGSDLIRSVTDMFAYWREDDEALVIAAGVLPEWLGRGDTVRVHGLRTPAGTVGYRMTRLGDDIVLELDPGVRVPPGGVHIAAPLERALRGATADGRPIAVDGTFVRLAHWPGRVVLR